MERAESSRFNPDGEYVEKGRLRFSSEAIILKISEKLDSLGGGTLMWIAFGLFSIWATQQIFRGKIGQGLESLRDRFR